MHDTEKLRSVWPTPGRGRGKGNLTGNFSILRSISLGQNTTERAESSDQSNGKH